MKSINELAKEIHQNAIDKGFFEKERNIGEMLCLIHSEVSEALEADRKGEYYAPETAVNLLVEVDDDAFFNMEYKHMIKGTFEEEMADIVIRVMDLCAFKNIDLETHIKAKMRYNSLREKYHGKKY
jgi:NTP pyrophosphatase (non-canonical NTP hydrolase)